MDPPQTHFRVVPMKFMDGPQLLTTYGCPLKVKNRIFTYNMEFSFTPYDLYQPTPDPFVNGPHEIYGWPPIPNNLWMAPTSKKLHFGL